MSGGTWFHEFPTLWKALNGIKISGQLETRHCVGALPNLSDLDIYDRPLALDIIKACGREDLMAPMTASDPNKNVQQATDKYVTVEVVHWEWQRANRKYTISFENFETPLCLTHNTTSFQLYPTFRTKTDRSNCDEYYFHNNGQIEELSTGKCLSLSVPGELWQNPTLVAENITDDICQARVHISRSILNDITRFETSNLLEAYNGTADSDTLRYEQCQQRRHVLIGVELADCNATAAVSWYIEPFAEKCVNPFYRNENCPGLNFPTLQDLNWLPYATDQFNHWV